MNVALEAGPGQAIGKAFGLEAVIAQLRSLGGDNNGKDEDESRGMADIDITYTVGEASDLWTEVFLPLKRGT